MTRAGAAKVAAVLLLVPSVAMLTACPHNTSHASTAPASGDSAAVVAQNQRGRSDHSRSATAAARSRTGWGGPWGEPSSATAWSSPPPSAPTTATRMGAVCPSPATAGVSA